MSKEIDKIVETLNREMSLKSLNIHYNILRKIGARSIKFKKLLAEVSYLMSVEYLDKGNYIQALKFAEESVSIYKTIDTNNARKAIPILWKYLPDYMHEGVVKQRVIEKIRKIKRKN